jgi:hypothetical protein
VEEGDALRTVASYIDLNPIRAGIVSDPGDYRWSGYGEAVAGGERSRESLVALMRKVTAPGKTHQKYIDSYRLELYVIGEEVPSDQNGEGGRRGFTKDQVSEVRKNYGEVSLKYSLNRRVRHFSEGLILGSMDFVQRHVHRYRKHAGSLCRTKVGEIRSFAGHGLFALRTFG